MPSWNPVEDARKRVAKERDKWYTHNFSDKEMNAMQSDEYQKIRNKVFADLEYLRTTENVSNYKEKRKKLDEKFKKERADNPYRDLLPKETTAETSRNAVEKTEEPKNSWLDTLTNAFTPKEPQQTNNRYNNLSVQDPKFARLNQIPKKNEGTNEENKFAEALSKFGKGTVDATKDMFETAFPELNFLKGMVKKDEYQNRDTTAEKLGANFRTGFYNTLESHGGTLGYLGEKIGSEGLTGAHKDISEFSQRGREGFENTNPKEFEWKDMASKDFYVDKASQQVPEMMLSLASGKVAIDVLGKLTKATKFSGTTKRVLDYVTGGLGMTVPETASFAGETYNQAQQMDDVNNTDAYEEAFMKDILLNTALNTLQVGVALTPLQKRMREVAQKGMVGNVADVGARTTVGGLIEGSQEVAQNKIQSDALNQEFNLHSPETYEAFALGSVMGGAESGAMAMMGDHYQTDPVKETVETIQKVDQRVLESMDQEERTRFEKAMEVAEKQGLEGLDVINFAWEDFAKNGGEERISEATQTVFEEKAREAEVKDEVQKPPRMEHADKFVEGEEVNWNGKDYKVKAIQDGNIALEDENGQVFTPNTLSIKKKEQNPLDKPVQVQQEPEYTNDEPVQKPITEDRAQKEQEMEQQLADFFGMDNAPPKDQVINRYEGVAREHNIGLDELVDLLEVNKQEDPQNRVRIQYEIDTLREHLGQQAPQQEPKQEQQPKAPKVELTPDQREFKSYLEKELDDLEMTPQEAIDEARGQLKKERDQEEVERLNEEIAMLNLIASEREPNVEPKAEPKKKDSPVQVLKDLNSQDVPFETQADGIPQDIKFAKPRYSLGKKGNFALEFENNLDKLLYIASATVGKDIDKLPKKEFDFKALNKITGLNRKGMFEYGDQLRARIKEIANNAETGTKSLSVPNFLEVALSEQQQTQPETEETKAIREILRGNPNLNAREISDSLSDNYFISMPFSEVQVILDQMNRPEQQAGEPEQQDEPTDLHPFQQVDLNNLQQKALEWAIEETIEREGIQTYKEFENHLWKALDNGNGVLHVLTKELGGYAKLKDLVETLSGLKAQQELEAKQKTDKTREEMTEQNRQEQEQDKKNLKEIEAMQKKQKEQIEKEMNEQGEATDYTVSNKEVKGKWHYTVEFNGKVDPMTVRKMRSFGYKQVSELDPRKWEAYKVFTDEMGEKVRKNLAKKKSEPKKVTGETVSIKGHSLELTKSKHTQKGTDIWLLKPVDTISDWKPFIAFMGSNKGRYYAKNYKKIPELAGNFVFQQDPSHLFDDTPVKEEPKKETKQPEQINEPPLSVIDDRVELPKVDYKETKTQIKATFTPVQRQIVPSIFKNDTPETPKPKILVFPKGKQNGVYNEYLRLPSGVSVSDINDWLNIEFAQEGVTAKELTDTFDYMNGNAKAEPKQQSPKQPTKQQDDEDDDIVSIPFKHFGEAEQFIVDEYIKKHGDDFIFNTFENDKGQPKDFFYKRMKKELTDMILNPIMDNTDDSRFKRFTDHFIDGEIGVKKAFDGIYKHYEKLKAEKFKDDHIEVVHVKDEPKSKPKKEQPKFTHVGTKTEVDRFEKARNQTKWLKEASQQARNRVKARRNDLNSLPMRDLADYAIIGADLLVEKSIDFAEFSDKMIKEFGSDLKLYMKAIHAQSQAVLDMTPEEIDEMLRMVDPDYKEETGGKDNDSSNEVRTDVSEEPERTSSDNVQGTGSERDSERNGSQRTRDSEGANSETDRQRNEDMGSGGNRSTASNPPSTVGNYRITDQDDLTIKGKKETSKRNIEIIKLAKQIEREGRNATAEEQKKLVQFVGWGGLKDALDTDWQLKEEWKGLNAELKEVLTSQEFNMAQGSRLNAHYTDKEIIQSMYEGLKHLGFNGGRILEPSMAVGHFIGVMPSDLASKSKVTGIELDKVTGLIGKLLYPQSDVRIKGFEETTLSDNFYDVAIGNVPFGSYEVSDSKYRKLGLTKRIHDYFFAKSLDKVREGGLLMFITSKGTMDKRETNVRKYLSTKGEFVGAIRLPSDAFGKSANTEVVTDIIILKKLSDGEIAKNTDWVDTDYLEVDGEEARVNKYFVNHPEMMLGKPEMTGSMYRGNEFNLVSNGNITKQLQEAFKSLPSDVFEKRTQKALSQAEILEQSISAPNDVKEGAFAYQGGKLYIKEGEKLIPSTLTGLKKDRVVGLISLRTARRKLVNAQIENKSKAIIDGLRKELNILYDKFTKKFGFVNEKANAQVFADDPDYYSIMALEKWNGEKKKAEKADIFTQDTVSRYVPVASASTPTEALAISLNEYGRVELPRIAELLNINEEKAIKDLGDSIFLDPANDHYVTREEYLSGNVRSKLERAKNAVELDGKFQKNVEALEKAMPETIPYDKIDVQLGSGWVDEKYMKEFVIDHLFEWGGWRSNGVKINYNQITSNWTLQDSTGKVTEFNNDHAFTRKWGTPYKRNDQIVESALNGQSVKVYDSIDNGDGTKTKRLNKKGTAEARQKVEALQDEFKNWLWKSDTRKKELEKRYNELFNSYVVREYDASFMPDTLQNMNPDVQLREHQKNAVYRITQGGNTLLAHAVGAGKTFEMIAGMMEMKRLGLTNKPMWIVPNHLVDQMARDFKFLYPNANIFVPTKKDFQAKNRKRMFAKVANNNYDAIIMAHSSFSKISMNKENVERFFMEQINQLELAIQAEAESGKRSKSRIRSSLETLKKNLEAKMDKKVKALTQDQNTATFEELGVDGIVVDEAHEFKNLMYGTKRQNVGGLGDKEGADKAFDLYMKVQYLQKLNGGKGVVFATGTPISNSIAEMYHMMRYLATDKLKEMGFHNFDAWADVFAEIKSVLELAPEGKGFKINEKIKDITNAPELLTLFHSFADVKTSDTLLEAKLIKHPPSKRDTVEVDASDALIEYVEELVERAEAVRAKRVEPDEDNMLKITNDGRKGALDMRLINPSLPDDPNSKVNHAKEKIFDVWKRTKKEKGTQLVFIDTNTPDANGNKKFDKETGETKFSVYHDLKDKLIRMGMPEKEISFIHEANTDPKKLKLFDDLNSGKVRVLLGSSGKMGAGMNVQKKLKALHHVDVPWRPSDLEQREGRILRQGNEWEEKDGVELYTYVQTNSFDAYMWQLIEYKAKMINKIMSGEIKGRRIEDEADLVLSASALKAIATGDPRIMDFENLKHEVDKLENERDAHMDAQRRNKKRLTVSLPHELEIAKTNYEKSKVDASKVTETKGDHFRMKIGGVSINSRKDAGKKLFYEIDKLKKANTREWTKVGEISGFDLLYRLDFSRNSKGEISALSTTTENLVISGQNQYPISIGTETGTVQSIENQLASISKKAERYSELVERHTKEKSALENAINQSFAKQKDLDEKRLKRDQLASELDIDKDQSNDDVDIDETTSMDDMQDELRGRVHSRVSGSDELGASAFAQRRPVGKVNPERKKREAEKRRYAFKDQELEREFNEADTMPKDKLMDTFKEALVNAKNHMFREFPHLPKTKEFSQLRHRLLELEAQKGWSIDEATNIVRALQIDLDQEAFDLYRRVVILRDLKKEAEDGRAVPFFMPKDKEVAFDVRVKEALKKIDSELSVLEKALQDEPEVEEALQLRLRTWNSLKEKYIANMDKVGVNVRGKLSKEDYFRHIVIDKAIEKSQSVQGSKKQLRTPKYSKILKERKGSEMAILTDYLHAEIEAMSQMIYDIEVADTINTIDEQYNEIETFKKMARDHNEAEFKKLASREEKGLVIGQQAEIIDKYRIALKLPTLKEFNKNRKKEKQAVSALSMIMKRYNQLHGMSISKLKTLATDGDLWKGDNGEWSHIVDYFDENGPTSEISTHEQYRYFSDLASNQEAEGNIEARTILKYTSHKRQFRKEVLGKQYKTWEDVVPNGYTHWLPDESNIFYSSTVLDEQSAEKTLTTILGLVQNDGMDFKEALATQGKALIMAGKREGFVVKEPISKTLNDMALTGSNRAIHQLNKKSMQKFKAWLLLRPNNIVNYVTRNLTGDIDRSFANPDGFKYLPRATTELKDYLYKGRTPSKEMRDWLRLGGIHSLLASQDFGDIRNDKTFKMKMYRASLGQLERITNLPKSAISKTAHEFRQVANYSGAIFRYAQYLSYLDQLKKKGQLKNYGASIKAEIDGLKGDEQKAFHLSNDLLIPYNKTSRLGQELAETIFPFWRFMEGNMRSYKRLAQNILVDDEALQKIGKGVIRKGVTATPFMLARAGKLVVVVGAFSILAELWNLLMFEEEEEELPEYVQDSIHIIYGRDKNGEILYFDRLGMLQDYLEWFGLEDINDDVKQVLNNERTVSEVVAESVQAPFTKLINAINPIGKWGTERLFGKKLFPDPTNPTPIYDKWEHGMGAIGLQKEFREFKGAITNTPTDNFHVKNWFAVKNSDPKENAYYYIQDEVKRFKEKELGKSSGSFSGSQTEKSEALYQYKIGVRYGDFEHARNHLQEYFLHGGTEQGIQQSIRLMHPLGHLAEGDQGAFVQSLSNEQREKLEKSLHFYTETLLGEKYTK